MRKLIPPALALAAALYAGCNQSNSPTPPVAEATAKADADPKKAEEHPHKPGQHGGIIVEIGRDNYHAEAVFEKGGVVRVYLLGKDEARVQEVEKQTLTAYVKREQDTESSAIALKPTPQEGDAEGKTSLFVGQLPADLQGKRVVVTVPSIRIAGERFRFSFASASPPHADDLPAKVTNDEERQLYLTPGGKYTLADIKANGNQTASQKFKNFRAAHDADPKAGDQICPITDTKANPRCTWIVGGKTYSFCCPPCVDEFVKLAKEHPEQVKEPEEYVKK
ncbi:MAG TPA: hypothetical protein VFA26_01480 [Gemmataceae bacterium]|nr:hypothetical protein [Gemmataceae bacterium]